MTTSSPVVISQILGFGVFLWLAMYLLVRATPRSAVITVSLVGLLSQAAFFFAGALTDTVTDPGLLTRLERAFWWCTVLPLAAWFHYSSLVLERVTGRAVWRPLVWLVYTLGALIIAAGTATDLFVAYGGVGPSAGGALRLDPGSAYGAYIGFQALTGCGALLSFVRATRHARRAAPGLRMMLRLLVGGSLLFLAGALWLSTSWGFALGGSSLPGSVLLLLGLALLGYGSVASGMLMAGQHVRRDLLYSVTGLAAVNALYVALLTAAGVTSALALLALVGLVTVTHTTYDEARSLLDRLFFSPEERAAREEARGYASLLSTVPATLHAEGVPEPYAAPPPRGVAPSPAGEIAEREAGVPDSVTSGSGQDEHLQPSAFSLQPSEKEFQSYVRRALSGLKSPPKLAQSPLLGLRLVGERLARAGLADNRLNRAAALRELLVEAIEGLRPDAGESGSHHIGDSWRFYNVLHYPYVRDMSRKAALAEARRLEQERRREGRREPGELEQVLAWLADVDEDTYYKWQRRASDTIALALWEQEKTLNAERLVLQ